MNSIGKLCINGKVYDQLHLSYEHNKMITIQRH